MNDSIEEWKPVVGYEGVYEVSTMGAVKRTSTQKLLHPTKKPNGYLSVPLSVGNVVKKKYVHRLVAEAFIGNGDSLDVNHRDHDRANNSIDNLEFATRKENLCHAASHGRTASCERNGRAKLKAEQVSEMRTLFGRISLSEIARRYGVSASTVEFIYHGKTWKRLP